jgi:hypothetical protein
MSGDTSVNNNVLLSSVFIYAKATENEETSTIVELLG